MENIEPHIRRIEYQRKTFSMRQIRDCVDGSDSIKRSGELYAPMPSGMRDFYNPNSSTNTGQTNPLADNSISTIEVPWNHSNPAYSAYLQRAKFPDITANTLRGLVGVATRKTPDYDLPSNLSYLEDVATLEGDNLMELYRACISEVLQVSRIALVLDTRPDNTLYIAEYSSESYINWQYRVINGRKVQTYAEFETTETNARGEEEKHSLAYSLEQMDENGPYVCMIYKFIDGKLSEEPFEFVYQGKTIDYLPIVNIGATDSTACPDPIPLMGVSDCSLEIYRKSADLNQAQFMTCNPTLVFIGVDGDDAPQTIGSTVAICLSDPSSDAKYISTDSSGIGSVKDSIQEVFAEAIQYGASLIGPTKRTAESAEALALRQAASGATLVTVVTNAAQGIKNVLNMAASLVGSQEVEFTPNIEFAETALSAQEMTALLSALMSGGISHQTFLENFSAAGLLRDRTPEDEMDLIEDEGLGTTTEPAPKQAEEVVPNDE